MPNCILSELPSVAILLKAAQLCESETDVFATEPEAGRVFEICDATVMFNKRSIARIFDFIY